MSATEMMERLGRASPRFKARIAGALYLLTFVGGIVALVASSRPQLGFPANLVADACYVAVTLLFYDLFRPVNRNLSLLAAIFGLLGCVHAALNLFHLAHLPINTLVFFGFYCLLIGYLIFRSTFLPRILGAGMTLAGLGWLTFFSPALAKTVSPYNFAAGMIGEGALLLWLLVFGVNAERWQAQAGVGEDA